MCSERLILLETIDSHLHPDQETGRQRAATVELSVVLTNDLDCGLNTPRGIPGRR